MPLSKFILTNSGEAVNSEMTMMAEAVRSVGISLLGGNANIHGKFELAIESIGATNEVRIHSGPAIQAESKNISILQRVPESETNKPLGDIPQTI